MADLDSGIVWSDKLHSTKEAVSKLGLPCMVKVVKGCKHEDFSPGHLLKLDFGIAIKKVAASFVPKRPSSGSGNKTRDIFIPLGYKGKVRISRDDAGRKVYTSLKDLIGDFPRYVQAEESFASVEEGSGKTLGVPSGGKLELDKAVGITSLYCKYSGKTIVLTAKDKIKFRLLTDDTTYTLQEVVDRLYLPQTARFLDPQFQLVVQADLAGGKCTDIGDTLTLSRVTSHEVIVGLLKPSESPTCGIGSVKKKIQPTLALFPLQASAAVNEVKVKVVADKNDKIYKSTMAKQFPQTVDRVLIQESFYVDMASNVNIHLQKENRWITVKPLPVKPEPESTPVNAPPPLPPDRKLSPRERKPPTPTTPTKEILKLSLDDDKSPPPEEGGNTSPRGKDGKKDKKAKEKKDKDKKGKDKDKKKDTDLDKDKSKKKSDDKSSRNSSGNSDRSSPPSSLSIEIDNLPIAPSTPSPSPPPAGKTTPKTDLPYKYGRPLLPTPDEYEVPVSSSKTGRPIVPIPDVYEEPVPSKISSSQKEVNPPDGQPNTYECLNSGATADAQDDNLYEELDMLVRRDTVDADKKKKDKTKEKEKDKDKKKLFGLFSGGKKKKDGSRNSATDLPAEPEKPVMPIDKIPDISSIGKTKPVGHVKPSTKPLPAMPDKPGDFSTLNVGDLVKVLRQCKLPDLASLCQKEGLDGDFLYDLSTDELTKEPYHLGSLHLKKLERIKGGWRPNE